MRKMARFRVPPHHPYSERCVLGCLESWNAGMVACWAILRIAFSGNALWTFVRGGGENRRYGRNLGEDAADEMYEVTKQKNKVK